MLIRHSFAASLLLLTACGGGGSQSTFNVTPPQPDPVTPSASLSISSPASFSSPFVTISGSSSDITGDITLTLDETSYNVVPASSGSWTWRAEQCGQAMENGPYSVTVQASASDGTTISESTTLTVNANSDYMRVHYYRQNADYDNWGLHLWGSAVTSAAVTTWASPRDFDCIQSGWIQFWVPLNDPNAIFNFIVHKGDNKNTPDDLALLPSTFGKDVFIVQNDPTLYASLAEAEVAIDNVGNASSLLDLSPVTVGETSSALPTGWSDSAAFIEIYVRGYKDSDGDGSGDLQGLIQQLPYLESLGIRGIWLMPITESSDNDHGYAVTNYRDIEDDYGDLSDFQTLLNEAHQRGIGIIIDYVMNHSSSANPLFLDALTSQDNDKRDWYRFASSDLGWGPWGNGWRAAGDGDYYYSPFSPMMPDFNLRNQDVVDFHLNNLRFWLNMGVDGFRFDAVGVLFESDDGSVTINHPDNHPLLAQALAVVNSYDNRYLVCEAPDGPALYAKDSSCGRAFAFGTQHSILQSVVEGKLHSDLYSYFNQPARNRMPLILSNHDHFAGDRPMSFMLSKAGITETNVDPYLKAAASLYILSSATPFTYYGEEVGQTGAGGDWDLRRPMSWTDDSLTAGFTTGTPFRPTVDNVVSNNVQQMELNSESLLSHYRRLYKVRSETSPLAFGNSTLLTSINEPVFAVARERGLERAYVVVNLSSANQVMALPREVGKQYSDVLQLNNVLIDNLTADTFDVTLPGWGSAVIVGQ